MSANVGLRQLSVLFPHFTSHLMGILSVLYLLCFTLTFNYAFGLHARFHAIFVPCLSSSHAMPLCLPLKHTQKKLKIQEKNANRHYHVTRQSLLARTPVIGWPAGCKQKVGELRSHWLRWRYCTILYFKRMKWPWVACCDAQQNKRIFWTLGRLILAWNSMAHNEE